MRNAALVVLALALALAGCATVTGGPTQQINISSSPAGARILIDGQQQGTTPQVVRFSRHQAPEIRILRDGCEAYALKMTKAFRVNKVIWGNLFLPPLFITGALVDVVSGSAFDLAPEVITADLVCQPT